MQIFRLKMAAETASYDIVIVGGDTAGCVVACRVTETTSLHVLLLEAGQDNKSDPKVTTPGRSRSMFGDQNYDWDYRTVAQEHAANRTFHQTRGRML